jgi:hypothetical protein
MEELIMKEEEKSYYEQNWKEALRNQLNIISTSIFLMEKGLKNNNVADAHRYLEKMKDAMERIKIILE